jgi:hypothetical protein
MTSSPPIARRYRRPWRGDLVVMSTLSMSMVDTTDHFYWINLGRPVDGAG